MVEASTIFGISGMAVAFLLFLSPLATLLTIIQHQHTKDYSQIPYLTQLVESFCWTLWTTTLPNRLEVLITNALGCLFMFIYVCIFIYYAQYQSYEKKKILNIQVLIAFFLMAVALTIFLAVDKPLSSTILVSSAVFYNCVKYSSPLSVAKIVISTKSVEFMPLSLTLACLLCSALWGMYGFLLSDIWILVPNVLGFFCSIAQGNQKVS